MKPTKEQLADPKWWGENTVNRKYCYWSKNKNEHFFHNEALKDLCHYELLAKRPEPEWMPQVDVDCELKLGESWVKCKADYICEQYIVVLMHGSNTYEALVRGHYELRPIKTQREEFIEEAKSRIKNMDADDIILTGKLYDSGCRFDLTEKDGE